MSAFSKGIRPFEPGKPVVASAMQAMPLEVALRPVSRLDRVGEQSAVVWKLEYRRPASAIRFMVGVSTGPPNTSIAP